MYLKNILIIIFSFIGIIYSFSNVCKMIRGLAIADAQIILMAVGIVGTLACTFMRW